MFGRRGRRGPDPRDGSPAGPGSAASLVLPLPAWTEPPLSAEARRRVELTVACRDADAIPKVPDAGAVRTEDGIRIQVMHEGTRIVAGCYHGDWMTEVIGRLRGHHEPQEERVLDHVISRLRATATARQPVMVELGAFWAFYSMWAMRALGARAVLVEPDPHNLEVGRVNLALNGLADAVFIHAAVGAGHGDSLELVCESDGVTRTLPTVTVPGLMADQDLDSIDLLLVDCQGPEVAVIDAAAETLAAGRVRFLVLSTHHHSISGDPMTHQRCRAALEALGAHIIAEHSVGESFSGDGLIAASFRPEDRDLQVPISYARYRDSMFGELEPELAAALGVV